MWRNDIIILLWRHHNKLLPATSSLFLFTLQIAKINYILKNHQDKQIFKFSSFYLWGWNKAQGTQMSSNLTESGFRKQILSPKIFQRQCIVSKLIWKKKNSKKIVFAQFWKRKKDSQYLHFYEHEQEDDQQLKGFCPTISETNETKNKF